MKKRTIILFIFLLVFLISACSSVDLNSQNDFDTFLACRELYLDAMIQNTGEDSISKTNKQYSKELHRQLDMSNDDLKRVFDLYKNILKSNKDSVTQDVLTSYEGLIKSLISKHVPDESIHDVLKKYNFSVNELDSMYAVYAKYVVAGQIIVQQYITSNIDSYPKDEAYGESDYNKYDEDLAKFWTGFEEYETSLMKAQ